MKKSYPFVCPPQQQGEKRKVPETVEAASPKNLELCPLPMPPSSWKVTSLASESSNMMNIWYHQRILLFIIGREWGVGSLGDRFKSRGSENLSKLYELYFCLQGAVKFLIPASVSVVYTCTVEYQHTWECSCQLPAESFHSAVLYFLARKKISTMLWQFYDNTLHLTLKSSQVVGGLSTKPGPGSSLSPGQWESCQSPHWRRSPQRPWQSPFYNPAWGWTPSSPSC